MSHIVARDRKSLNIAVKHFAVKALLALIALVVLIAAGCGKRGAPVPPKERVLQRVEISGFQRGNQVILSWKMPAKNAPVGNVQNISRADIYRLAEPLSSPLALSEEEFANRSTLSVMPISDSDLAMRTCSSKDTLRVRNQAHYAMQFVNSSDRKRLFRMPF